MVPTTRFPTGRTSAADGGTSADRPIRAAADPDPTKAEIDTTMLPITSPGVYDLPAEVYHADPVAGGSLSHSGAKLLMPPKAPAFFKAWLDGDLNEHKEEFDFGAAAHHKVLGIGDDVVVVAGTGKDPNSWRTEADKAAVQAVRDAGKRPIRPHDVDTIAAMAAALRAHPWAANLLNPAAGAPERTLVWQDKESGVWCRAMIDFLRHTIVGQRLVLVDYKTADEVDPDTIAKAVANFCYYGQGAWYVDGAEELGLSPAGQPAFILIFQRKTAPHLVVCAQLHPDDIGRGHDRNRKARDLYRVCRERDQWPGYADDRVISTQLPTWKTYQHDAALLRGDFEPEGKPL